MLREFLRLSEQLLRGADDISVVLSILNSVETAREKVISGSSTRKRVQFSLIQAFRGLFLPQLAWCRPMNSLKGSTKMSWAIEAHLKGDFFDTHGRCLDDLFGVLHA